MDIWRLLILYLTAKFLTTVGSILFITKRLNAGNLFFSDKYHFFKFFWNIVSPEKIVKNTLKIFQLLTFEFNGYFCVNCLPKVRNQLELIKNHCNNFSFRLSCKLIHKWSILIRMRVLVQCMYQI